MKKKPPKSIRQKKSITIDDLAFMMAGSFKEVDGKFKVLGIEMNEQFNLLEGRLTIVEQKVDLLRADIQELRYDYKKVITRIENLELKAFGSVQE